jgi:hypothetical protein
MHRLVIAAALAGLTASTLPAQAPAEVLRPVGGLSQAVCDSLLEPIAFVQASNGRYLLLDRRRHTVYAVDRTGTERSVLVQAGLEKGEALQPAALSMAPDDSWAVTDAPFRQERIQIFTSGGSQIRAFLRPGLTAPRLAMGPVILNGVGSLQFTGDTFLINAPETGALISELDLDGNPIRQIGRLRDTGHEADQNVHLALNIGLALRHPDGGFVFVFQTGVPKFRKYDADGDLVYERHIEGSHLDPYVQSLPTTWPTRKAGDGLYPIVPPTIRTAAIDPSGNLWVSLIAPVTYIYDSWGDKRRTIKFDGTGNAAPTSLTFSRASGATRALVLPGCYEYEVPEVPGSRSPGVPKSRSPGVPESRSPGVPESRSPGVPESRSPGVPESRSPGVPESRSPGVLKDHPASTMPTRPTSATSSAPGTANRIQRP